MIKIDNQYPAQGGVDFMPFSQSPVHRQNNFDTLRIVAAVAVIFSHSIPLTYGPKHIEDLWTFSRHQATLGSIALQVFFVISGYLITRSYIISSNPRRFIRSRFLRLVPALLLVQWLLALVAGPLLTTLPLAGYFSSFLPYRAALGLSDHLPGVFTNNPFSSGINGSLWTLRYEALCYAVVLLLGTFGLLKRNIAAVIFILLLAARYHVGSYAMPEFGALFAAGSLLYFWQPKLRKSVAVISAILWLASMRFGLYFLISDTFGAYLIIYLALAVRLPNLSKYGDLSYGVYIFAWPIQQSISMLLHVSWVANILITLPIVLSLAFLSWRLVEEPALRLKDQKLFAVF